MAKAKPWRSRSETLKEHARSMAEADKKMEDQEDRQRSLRSSMPLERILDREENTRALQMAHVKELVDSIVQLGLINPITVDQTGRLLAGGHRLAALRALKRENPERFTARFPDSAVPVFTIPIDEKTEASRALAIELSENEKRRNYTRSELSNLVERMRAAGYTTEEGRPKAGDKRLAPALSLVLGQSMRHVRRLLSALGDENKRAEDTQVRGADVKRAKARCRASLRAYLLSTQDARLTGDDLEFRKAVAALLEIAVPGRKKAAS